MDIKIFSTNPNAKPFWQSKMFWLGILQVGIGIASYIEGNAAVGTPITVSGIMTVILRGLTSEPIKMSK